MARTAVVAGTATAVAGRVSRRQQLRWAAQDQPQYVQEVPQEPAYAPAAPAAPVAADPIAQLKELADLKAQGVLTDQEFETQKARLLSS
jgi:hypothetical protein